MQFIESIKQRAKNDVKTIILPEAEDRRVLEATSKVIEQGFANIVLIGNKEQIEEDLKEFNVDITKIRIIDINNSNKKQQYAEKLFELRKHKGLTIEQASELINSPIYYGMMMLKDENEVADGLVSGAIHSTADTLRPALQILKTKPRYKISFCIFCDVCT